MARRNETKGRGQKGPSRRGAAGAGRMPRWMLVAGVVVLAGVGILLVLPYHATSSTAWPQNRGPLGTFVEDVTTDGNLTKVRITYPSLDDPNLGLGGTARAILWVPNRTNNTTALLPAVVHMTGRTVDAGGARNLAVSLGSLGVATLSVEKRGGDSTLTPEKTRLWVWDVLRGFDALRGPPLRGPHGENLHAVIDPTRIAASGDSIGANVALVAASKEPRFKGAISFSGFPAPDPRSGFGPDLDPATAVGQLNGNPVAFFHSRDDSIVPFAEGRALFDLAREPKFFYAVNGTCHGYCPDMFPQLEEAVRQILLVAKR